MDTELRNYTPTVANMLRHCVDIYSGLMCVIRGEERLTFEKVDQRSAQLALALLYAGIGKGSRVAVLMPDGPDWVISWLAINRIGAILIPISTFSQARELQWILRHSDTQLVLTVDRYLGHNYLSRLQEALPGLQDGKDQYLPEAPYLRKIVVWCDARPSWAIRSKDFLASVENKAELNFDFLAAVEKNVVPADLGVVIYTSGTTSMPKGVVHSQGAIVRHSYSLHRYDIKQPGQKALNAIPMFWVGGMIYLLMTSMHCGTAIVTPVSKDLGDIIKLIKEERIQHLDGWMHGFASMREHPDYNEDDFDFVMPSMVAYGLFPARDAMGKPIPSQLTPDKLGQTETLGPHSMCPIHTVLTEDQVGSFGTCAPRLTRKIVEPETGKEVPTGGTGELYVRGYSVLQGYYKKEREDVFTEDGFHKTGDLCSIDESDHLYFKGRSGEMIKSAGANVAPREVETAIMAQPEIAEAAVVGMPDNRLNEIVVAVVVLKQGRALSSDELSRRLRRELSSYKVPKRYAFVAADELPRTAGGKIKKSEVKTMSEVTALGVGD